MGYFIGIKEEFMAAMLGDENKVVLSSEVCEEQREGEFFIDVKDEFIRLSIK